MQRYSFLFWCLLGPYLERFWGATGGPQISLGAAASPASPLEPSLHAPLSSAPVLTGERFPLPVNTGRVDGRRFPLAVLTARVDG